MERVAVFGLDGVPYGLLMELFDRGVMPNLSAIARVGSFQRMTTTLPPVSSSAWTSFMTGSGPGDHGIFGFTDVEKGTRKLRLPSFDHVRAPTLWHCLSDRYSLVVNLPFTYPARPLNGTLIAGFVSPIFERSVYPPDVLPMLVSRGYRIDVDAAKGRTDRSALIDDLFATLAIREQTCLDLMNDRPWNLCIAVVTGTDRLNHFFYDAAFDASQPYHSEVMDYYRRVDAFFGAFAARIGPTTRLFVLSDHGFTELKTQVYLNTILGRLGYLSFTGPRPRSIDDLAPDCTAFAMDPTRIYLNRSDRFRMGTVHPEETDRVIARLKTDLSGFTVKDALGESAESDDEPDAALFERVIDGRELYDGPCVADGPDLVLVPRRGYDVRATVGVDSVSRKDIFSGMHTHDDAVLISNDPALPDRLTEPDITQPGREILALLHGSGDG